MLLAFILSITIFTNIFNQFDTINYYDKMTYYNKLYTDALHIYNLNESNKLIKEINKNNTEAIRSNLNIDKLQKELNEAESLLINAVNDELSIEEIASLENNYIRVSSSLTNAEEVLEKTLDEVCLLAEIPNTDITKDIVDNYKILYSKYKKLYDETIILGDTEVVEYPVINSRISNHYGIRNVNDKVEFYNGIEFYIQEESNVNTIFGGKVATISANKELGNYIIVDHGKKLKTVYSNLSSVNVKKGQKLKQYAKLGRVKSKLKLSIYYNGKSMDPEELYKN